MLNYMNDMGIDPIGLGFAAFLQKDENGKITAYDTSYLPEDVKTLDGGTWSTLFEASDYYDQLEKIAKDDILYKYIIENERIYMGQDITLKDINEASETGNLISGMLNMRYEGVDGFCSDYEINRGEKLLRISSGNIHVDEVGVYVDEFGYNLDGWAGRYGMPFEFLMAIHMATMTSEITEQMADNPYLNTQVNILLDKKNYALDFKFVYNGETLKVTYGTEGDLSLYNKIENNIKKKDEEEDAYEYTGDKIEAEEITVCALYNLIQELMDSTYANSLGKEPMEALLGKDTFIVRNTQADSFDIDYENNVIDPQEIGNVINSIYQFKITEDTQNNTQELQTNTGTLNYKINGETTKMRAGTRKVENGIYTIFVETSPSEKDEYVEDAAYGNFTIPPIGTIEENGVAKIQGFGYCLEGYNQQNPQYSSEYSVRIRKIINQQESYENMLKQIDNTLYWMHITDLRKENNRKLYYCTI